jgi:predicted oxidoreductase (fatty acid repression mutant protein)
MTSTAYLSAVAARRSYYMISPKSPIDESKIKAIVDDAVKHTPSPYNIQSGRALLLLDEANQHAWQVVKTKLLDWLPKDNEEMANTHSKKIAAFSAGYGTVLLFEDQDTIDAANKKWPM